ncbi:unnamed protein product [Amaranthus hypochondriacus]
MELLRMVVGIIIVVVLLFMPTSAQEDSCWDRIGTCLSSVSSDEIEQCCPVLTGEINDERDCFCGVERVLAENATIADAVSQFLSVCSVNASFNTLCPVKFQDAPCWQTVANCVGDNVNKSETVLQLDPSSSSFNATEFFCCPLMQQIATAEKHCFCSVDSLIQQDPSLEFNFTQIFTLCSITPSLASDFCLAQAPSPGLDPIELLPILGSSSQSQSLSVVTADGSKSKDKSGAQASGGYRIVIRRSFSILLGLFTIFLFQR